MDSILVGPDKILARATIRLGLLYPPMKNDAEPLAVVWIEHLEQQPSSTLYKILIPHYKPVYGNNDRFIFYNFAPVKTSTLDHIVDILQYIDISHWFVTIVTNQTATQQYFNSLSEPIRVEFDSNYTSPEVESPVEPLFNTNQTMCAHAWAGIHVTPEGSAKLCCNFIPNLKGNAGQEFNIRQHSIIDIVNSDHVKALRQEFRQGKTPSGCANCVATEKSGGTSKRQLTRFKLQNIWGYIDWESDSLSNLGFIGGHLGNLCNLKCRICNENFSSSIAAEKIANSDQDIKTNPVYSIMHNNNWKHHNEIFFSNIKQLPQLRNFEFLGGEPLMVKENIEFMQYLVDSNFSHDCIFEFVTNGTQYHDVFDCADRFKRLSITVSIDDIEQRFEYQRSGARWDQLKHNLQKFLSNTGLKIGVSITVNIQNVLYLPELITWLLSQGVEDYSYNVLLSPNWLSIKNLTPDAKTLVLKKLSSSGLDRDHQANLNYIINVIQNSNCNSSGQEFVKNILSVDYIRNENFAVVHPEIAQVMGFK